MHAGFYKSINSGFVGRSGEIEALDGALRRAFAGEPQCVLISGEAGVGKSRLLQEFLAAAEEAGTSLSHCISRRRRPACMSPTFSSSKSATVARQQPLPTECDCSSKTRPVPAPEGESSSGFVVGSAWFHGPS
jgi:hypothetical protein